MSSRRAIVTTAIVLLAFIAVYLLQSEFIPSLTTMAPSSSIPIEVHISTDASTASILGSMQLRITLTNTSPHAISILRWSSPLDNHLPALGVVSFISTKTGDTAPCLDMKINHRMPPAGYFEHGDASIVKIPANGKVENVVIFKEPEVALMKGEEYRVSARGRWMGVWRSEGSEGGKLMLGEAQMTGEFKSNEVVVRIAGDDGAEL